MDNGKFCLNAFAALTAMACLAVSSPTGAQEHVALSNCWNVELDSVETGKVIQGGVAANISMYQHPFHFVQPTEPAPKHAYRVCLDPNEKRGGTLDLGNAKLKLTFVDVSRAAGQDIYLTTWKMPGEKDGALEFRLNPRTHDAQVTVLRGKARQRIGMLGTGKATPIGTHSK